MPVILKVLLLSSFLWVVTCDLYMCEHYIIAQYYVLLYQYTGWGFNKTWVKAPIFASNIWISRSFFEKILLFFCSFLLQYVLYRYLEMFDIYTLIKWKSETWWLEGPLVELIIENNQTFCSKLQTISVMAEVLERWLLNIFMSKHQICFIEVM